MTATAPTARGARRTDTLRAAARDPYVRALAAITVASAALRFAVIGIPSYWLDEAFTIVILKGSLSHALSLIPDTESTPPVYYVLAWGWAKVFGTGEAGVRSLSAIFGTLTVPVVAAAARQLADRRTALVAAAMVAANPFLVWFAQEARAYSLMVLLAAIGFLLFVRLLDRPDGRTVAGWAGVSALLLATHYYGALMIAAEAAWLLFARPRLRARALTALVFVGLVGIALAPLAIAQRHNRLAVPLAEESSTVLRTVQVPKQFLVGFDAPAEVVVSVLSFALVLAAVGLLVARRSPSERDRLAPAAVVGVAVLVVPVALAVAGFDYVSARYEVAAMVPLTICVAAGFAAPRARRAGLVLFGALLVCWVAIVVGVARDPLLQTRAAWRPAAQEIGPVPAGGRVVVLTPAAGEKPFEVYLPGARPLRAPVVSVSEIVDLSVRSTGEHVVGATAPAPGTLPLGLPPAFREVQRKRTRTSLLVRYRAPGPVAVPVNVLGGTRVDALTWVGLLQR